MHYLAELKQRFEPVLAELVDDAVPLLDMIRRAQDDQHGDYQANFAMSLCKQLGRSNEGPQVAQEILDQVNLDGLCESAEVAGKGFINFRIAADRLNADFNALINDNRLGVSETTDPRTIVVDFSSPNIAKPMHVGHIRSTVIGDAISRMLRFMGHKVVTDNHIGDWGTQFGMILYGYKNFLDEPAFDVAPVAELSRLYQLVNKLVSYHAAVAQLPSLQQAVAEAKQYHDEAVKADEADSTKKTRKKVKQTKKNVEQKQKDFDAKAKLIDDVDADPVLGSFAKDHADIGTAVLNETAKLHQGDEVNRSLWEQFLPSCRDEMQKIYNRLDIKFDYELGESFYHDQLPGIVKKLVNAGHAVESDGAMCVFMDEFKSPMIIQKSDGAYLYATTDLATIDYRVQEWNPDEILYVVDSRQSEHFEKLFRATSLINPGVNCMHVSFGTVQDKTGKPFKTRDGAVGLEWLLDLAIAEAQTVVVTNDEAKPGGPEIDSIERKRIAEIVGHAAIKYFDLAHNRESDYVFDARRMTASEGNTATYMQYSYARTAAILRKSGANIEALRKDATISIVEPAERALALEVLQLEQAIQDALLEYRPNHLAAYVFELASKFSTFFDQCHVNKSKEPIRSSRLLICDIVGRTIKTVLSLFGIGVVERM